ncbi:hypothetical protein GCM10028791_19980 [Echinicola sediminis]
MQFLDADDLLSPKKLEIQLHGLKNEKENVISYTHNTYFNHNEPHKHFPDFMMQGVEWMPKISGNGSEVLSTLMVNNFAVISSPLVNHNFLKSNRIRFPECLNSKVDWIFWIDCILSGAHLKYIEHPETTTMIRRHAKSITVQENVLKFGELHARDVINKKLSSAKLDVNEKLRLVKKNKHGKSEFLKQLFYTNSFKNKQLLISLFKNTGPITFVKYFLKGLNFKRKKIR